MRSRPTILVVESDQGVREAIALLLHQLGFEVILAEAGSGAEALTLIADVDALDGLYVEVGLNGAVNGWMVADKFRAAWPMRPIIYASGTRPKPPHLAGTDVFLCKPFDPQVFADAFEAIRSHPRIGRGAGLSQ